MIMKRILKLAARIFLAIIAMLCTFFMLGVLMSGNARAESSIELHGYSFHADKRIGGGEFNQFNAGVGFRYGLSDSFSVQAGFYKNSYDEQTRYLVAQWQPITLLGARAGVFAGYASGYVNVRYPVAGGFMATAPVSNWGHVTVRLVPKMASNMTTTLAVDLGMRF